MPNSHQKLSTFNSPLETGVRSLVLLTTAYPASYDLQHLVSFDYLIVHSGDVDGPDSLHPPIPFRSGELLVRRNLVEKGLLLMISRGLISRNFGSSGIEYQAEDIAGPFIDALNTPYLVKLKKRANWVCDRFRNVSPEELENFIKKIFDKWTIEFQSLEYSYGADT